MVVERSNVGVLGNGLGNQLERNRMVARGYLPKFECTYGCHVPDDFVWPNDRRSGWAMRRALKSWCKKHDIHDYIILRATDWVEDLHGPAVYELWTKAPTP